MAKTGSVCGSAGEGHLRVCFGSQDYETLEKAMDPLSRFFNAL